MSGRGLALRLAGGSFWLWFGVIWLVAGAGIALAAWPAAPAARSAPLLGLGALLATAGAVLVVRGLRRVLDAVALTRTGTPVQAAVTAVRPTDVRLNQRTLWRVHYRYEDHLGESHEGRSGLLLPDEADRWRVGATGAARFDPHYPDRSLWLGDELGKAYGHGQQ